MHQAGTVVAARLARVRREEPFEVEMRGPDTATPAGPPANKENYTSQRGHVKVKVIFKTPFDKIPGQA